MKIEEAKSILHGYRPNGADAANPHFREALALSRNDATLRAWFEKQQAFDQAMSADFEAIEVPESLCDAILSAADAAAAETPRSQWWRGRLAIGFAVAASIAVILTLTLTLKSQAPQSAAASPLAAFVISDAQHPETHGGHGEEAAALNRLLKLSTTRLSDPRAIDFPVLHDTGCRTLHLESRDVLEVCFKRNGAGLHYYIARRTDFPNLTAPSAPAIADHAGVSIASWSDQTYLYLVVSPTGRTALEKIL